jgi:ubiquinone/menaquinone biosynthesis C-methylase UbiE
MGIAMTGVAEQKRAVRDVHAAQTGEFVESYRRLVTDPFGACFGYSRFRLAQSLERLLPDVARSPRVLDVGCGTGHHIECLRARGHRVTGLDGSVEMLREARAVPGIGGLLLGDAERLPFAASSFDLVMCIEVLRYLPKTSPCVSEIARVLRPGGGCLVTASPLLSLNGYPIVNRLAGWSRIPSLVRLRQFFHTSWALRHSFRAAGFARVEVHGVYCGPINWIERLLPAALPTMLRLWAPVDALLADTAVLRELSNMFLVHAVRGDSGVQ